MLDLTPVMRWHAARRLRRLAAQDAAAEQQRQLLALVKKAAGTRFGRAHDFAGVRSVADYQARVPLRRYEQFWSEYWQPVFPVLEDCTWPGRAPYFAVSSGTTAGRTKYIPCTREMSRANTRAALDLLVHHLANRPASRFFGGRSFMLGGSTSLVAEAPGVFSGDLSGIAVNEVPFWARPYYFPPRALSLLSDWEQKLARMGPLSLQKDIRSVSGVPSWLLILFDKLFEQQGLADHRLVNLYPRLEMLVHGGVNFSPYRHRFRALLEGSHAELREVYPASEGFIAVEDGPSEEGAHHHEPAGGRPLRLIVDNGIFFEFVPRAELDSPAPTRHWTATLEPGLDYAVVLSTNAGLWGYVLGDTVRFVERTPPRLVVTGRTSYYLSAFGEHLTGEEVEQAVARAGAAIGVEVSDFSVGSRFPEQPGQLGGHRYVVEFAAPVTAEEALADFAARIDEALCALNDDYRAHRAEGFGLDPPQITLMTPGGFSDWMKRRGKLGGQHKVPRIINDAELFQGLLEHAARWGGAG